VSVRLGNGDGTFQIAQSYAVDANPDSVVVGDFNGDGYPDLAVNNYKEFAMQRYLPVRSGLRRRVQKHVLMFGAAVLALTVTASGARADYTQQLFYRADTGLALTGSIGEGGLLSQFYTYGLDSGWTHITNLGGDWVLIYSADTGLTVTGQVNADNTFTQLQVFYLGAGWTHVVGLGNALVLFYDAPSGLAVTGRLYSDGTFQEDYRYQWDTGWTHFAGPGSGVVLIYNANTGVAVTGFVDLDGIFTQQRVYQFDTGWTHFVGTNGMVLIYNADTGIAVPGYVNAGDGTFGQSNVYSFSTGWTHFTASPGQDSLPHRNLLLIYNADSGVAVTGRLNQDGLGNVTFTQFYTYWLDTGWTHITATDAN
jgi:hypothetical protein